MRVRIVEQEHINLLDKIAKKNGCSMQVALAIVLDSLKLNEAEHDNNKAQEKEQ